MEYHQARFDNARNKLLGLHDSIRLEEALKIPDSIDDSIHKCRIVYSEKINSMEFTKYDKRLPNSIKLIYDDEIDYSFKYEKRERLKYLVESSGADEIVIVKNGMITDTSRSNIVLSDGNSFVTPATFLLEGTKRKELLDRKIIGEEKISVENLFLYKKLFLINAMLDLENQSGFPIIEIIR